MDKRVQTSDSSIVSLPRRPCKQVKLDSTERRIESLFCNKIKIEVAEDLYAIQADLIRSRDVGLTVISEQYEFPLAICMTATEKIYVFYPGIKKHIKFICNLLELPDLTFFTIDGAFDSLCLSHCGIQLGERSVLDLQSINMHLTYLNLVFSSQPNDKLGLEAVTNKIKPSRGSLEKLVKRWFREDLDLSCTAEELRSVGELPLSDMAVFMIKKKAALVRCLGLAMIEKFEDQMRQPSDAIYSLALRADPVIREEYDRKGSRNWSDLMNTLALCPALDEDQDMIENNGFYT